MKPRILYAGFFHETHTFVDDVTRWADFDVALGDAVLAKHGDGSPTDGFLDEAARQGFAVIPTLDARATPSGTVADAAFEMFWSEFAARAAPALAAGVDGIFLVLHGAMVTETWADAEGELLARIRGLTGADAVPIFGVLDLHANVSAKMCALANGLVMYRENPHIDAKDAARRGTALLARCLRERRVPHMAWGRPPIVWAPPGTGTGADPMRSLELYAHQLEATQADVWACNVTAGFSFADTPDTGVSLSLVTVAAAEAAHGWLRAGAQLAWSLRERGDVRYPGVDEVVARIATDAAQPGPVLLVEPADNIGAGAPGDSTGILRALLAHHVANSLVVINDPVAVAALADLAIGATREIAVGGRGSRLDEGPVTLPATLVSRSGGGFELEDKQSHLASMVGSRFEMGPCAVVRSAGVTILLTSRKTPPFDLGQLRSQGLEPRDFAVIGVKAAVAHKRAYDPIARASHYVDTRGPCSSNLATFAWRKLRRPVWPLDTGTAFSCTFS
jgi:microcystin degradation protein MlrC